MDIRLCHKMSTFLFSIPSDVNFLNLESPFQLLIIFCRLVSWYLVLRGRAYYVQSCDAYVYNLVFGLCKGLFFAMCSLRSIKLRWRFKFSLVMPAWCSVCIRWRVIFSHVVFRWAVMSSLVMPAWCTVYNRRRVTFSHVVFRWAVMFSLVMPSWCSVYNRWRVI